MARDISAEILEKQRRRKENREYKALASLIHSYQTESHDKEFLKYIPIATIAHMESTIRSNIAALIDFGQPYSNNLKNLSEKDLKLDFDILNKIQAKEYTLGHFVSHVLSFSKYEDINSRLTTILGNKDNFTVQLKGFKQSKFEYILETSEQFVNNSNDIIADVEKMFKLRHIIAHEFPTKNIERDEIVKYFNSCNIFINHTNNYIWRLIQPLELVTQSEMNRYAYEEYEKATKELDELTDKIKSAARIPYEDFTDINLDLFEKSMEYWWQYTETSAQAHYKTYERGTIYKSLYYPHITNLIKEKIASLQEEFKYFFEQRNV